MKKAIVICIMVCITTILVLGCSSAPPVRNDDSIKKAEEAQKNLKNRMAEEELQQSK